MGRLRQLGDKSLTQAVLGCCDDRVDDVVTLAIDVVGRIAQRGDPEVVGKLLDCVSVRPWERSYAAFSLGLAAEENDDHVIATLLDLFEDRLAHVRKAAVAALTNVATCTTNESVRSALENCLVNDCTPSVKSYATRALDGEIIKAP